MASTTNYSWTTPDDTDLVKDGAAAIRTLGSAIDTTVFTNAGNAVQKSTIDAKGDLLVGTADNTVGRLAVGTNGYTLVADSAETTGLKWVAAGGGKVLQVVQYTTTTEFTQVSTTYADITNYNLSITPSAASSKVLVIFNPALFAGGTNVQIYQEFKIIRDSTDIFESKGANVQGAAATGGYAWQYVQTSFIYLDSPNTTSSVNYKAQTRTTGVNLDSGINLGGNSRSNIILVEIGA